MEVSADDAKDSNEALLNGLGTFNDDDDTLHSLDNDNNNIDGKIEVANNIDKLPVVNNRKDADADRDNKDSNCSKDDVDDAHHQADNDKVNANSKQNGEIEVPAQPVS